MCLACGFPIASGDWTEAGSFPGPAGAGDRAKTLSILSGVLAHFDLKVQPVASSGRFKVSTPSGRHAYARSVCEVWPVAAELLGRSIDPLDATFAGGAGERNV